MTLDAIILLTVVILPIIAPILVFAYDTIETMIDDRKLLKTGDYKRLYNGAVVRKSNRDYL